MIIQHHVSEMCRPTTVGKLSILFLANTIHVLLQVPCDAVIHEIDIYIEENCLRRGSDINKRGYNLAAWEMVSKPEEHVVQAVHSATLNDDLLLKHLIIYISRKMSLAFI